LAPVAIVRWLIGYDQFYNASLAFMLSVTCASTMGAVAFFVMQIFYTLNGYTMHDYHVGRHKEQLDSDGETVKERLELVFGRRWYLNFIVPQFWMRNWMTPAIARNIFMSMSKEL